MFSLIPWRRTEPVIRRREGDPFELMRRDFDRFFNRFFEGWPVAWPETNWEYAWGVTMDENDKEVIVRFELPGFETEEIDLRLAGNVLSVEAEHKEVGAKEGEEVQTRHVRREITLPTGLDFDKVEARYHSGILEVKVPKTPEAQGRKIEVKA